MGGTIHTYLYANWLSAETFTLVCAGSNPVGYSKQEAVIER